MGAHRVSAIAVVGQAGLEPATSAYVYAATLPSELLSHMGRPAALLAGRLREDCAGEAGIEPAFLGGKVSKPLSSAAVTERRQSPGGMPRSRQRGSDALGDHFDLARNPVPDEQGVSQLLDYGAFMGHKPRTADKFRLLLIRIRPLLHSAAPPDN